MMKSTKASSARWRISDARRHYLTMKLIEDYDIFQLAVAHHDEMQARAAAKIGAAAGTGDVFQVLELGCGTGITTRALLGAAPNILVTCIDIEPSMIEATQRSLKHDACRVSYREGDITAVLSTLRNASFDAIASAFTLHHIEGDDLDLTLVEALRVLKPGGLFVNADKIAHPDNRQHAKDLREQIEAFSAYDSVGRPDLRVEWTDHYLADEATHLDELEHNAALEAAGFVDVRTIWRARMEAIVAARKPGPSAWASKQARAKG